MIIQLRGTSGSGKSTAMREAMRLLGEWSLYYLVGRKRPLYCELKSDPNVVALGHYESLCGGGDTIGSARAIYDLVTKFHDGSVILVEGLLLSEDTRHTMELVKNGWDVRVIFLTTPLERCLKWIGRRRAEVGNGKPLNPSNTTNRVAVIERARRKLTQAGVKCYRRDPRQAPGIIVEWVKEVALVGV